MSDARITLYRDTQFGGRAVAMGPCGTSHLGRDEGFNDQASSIIVQRGIWLVYNDTDYSGPVHVLTPGEYPNPGAWRGQGNAISSLRPLPGVKGDGMLILFKNGSYGGRMVPITGPTADLKSIDFNNAASSVIVLGRSWLLHRDANFRGTTWPVSSSGGPDQNGYYPSASGFFDNDAISSLKPQ
ncbi:beta/gamma crystallin-related protein [Myxococcus landrumensis]|uniref:Beta/gamma crystallin 'Greek key' domain-containing protein n=1 Tax=Myxococcus landrumensis TaxID=2813577 RepID=A0ABX7NJP1_9BACT|nr:beta/gamma crystallin-related protein [Myxococcus landrumus]QSQ17611.1 hypothetical protein JY572_16890 [Myxococcus landrumus]